jgi:hypothetical protein
MLLARLGDLLNFVFAAEPGFVSFVGCSARRPWMTHPEMTCRRGRGSFTLLCQPW